MSSPWTWDPQRQAYYLWNANEGVYVYQDGRRVDLNGRNVPTGGAAPAAAATAETPRRGPASSAVQSQVRAAGGGASKKLSTALENMHIGADYSYGSSGAYTYGSSGTQPKDLTPGEVLPSLVVPGPSKDISDPTLAELNILPQGRLRGTWKEHDKEDLFPGFRVRKHASRFFVRGRVIRVLWPELGGDYNSSVTWTKDARYGEGIVTKIRWFIVVKENQRFCTCIPVQTYGGRGVSKPGLKRAHHAIAYDKRKEPDATEAEKPSKVDPFPMLTGIRINPKKKGDKLDKMSRIDFARSYTVEHNVKVYDFGMVDNSHIDRLAQQWVRVMLQGEEMQDRINPLTSRTAVAEESSSDESEPDLRNRQSAGRKGKDRADDDEEAEDEEDEEEEEAEDPRDQGHKDPSRKHGQSYSSRTTETDRSGRDKDSKRDPAKYRRR